MEVFFVKQKTAYEMRISDWSSDVCSSDLGSPPFVVLVASLGLFIVIANTLAIVFGTDAKTLPDFSYGIYFIGDVVVTGVQIAQVLVFVLVALALSAFLKYGAWGSAVRAVPANVDMARIVGLDPPRVRTEERLGGEGV